MFLNKINKIPFFLLLANIIFIFLLKSFILSIIIVLTINSNISPFYDIEISTLVKPIKPYYVCQPRFNKKLNDNLNIGEVKGILPVGREEVMGSDWIYLYTVEVE